MKETSVRELVFDVTAIPSDFFMPFTPAALGDFHQGASCGRFESYKDNASQTTIVQVLKGYPCTMPRPCFSVHTCRRHKESNRYSRCQCFWRSGRESIDLIGAQARAMIALAEKYTLG